MDGRPDLYFAIEIDQLRREEMVTVQILLGSSTSSTLTSRN
jgi:hypothetical protein